MIRSVRSTPFADEDLISILHHTVRKFGVRTAFRYKTLIDKAIADLSVDAHRFGSQERFSIKDGLYFYHLKHSKLNIANKRERIYRPRHYIVFRLPSASELHIIRLLHERMKLDRQQFHYDL